MGKDVKQNLIDLLQEDGEMDETQALSYLENLQQDSRYHEDLYWAILYVRELFFIKFIVLKTLILK